jgi:hypothetical protein
MRPKRRPASFNTAIRRKGQNLRLAARLFRIGDAR